MVQWRLFDYDVDNINEDCDNDSEEEEIKYDKKTFVIRMFGMNTKGETASIIVKDFHPFFFVKVSNLWEESQKNMFLSFIKRKLRYNKDKAGYYEKSIIGCDLVKKKFCTF